MDASPSPTSIFSLVSIEPGDGDAAGPCDTGARTASTGSKDDEPAAFIDAWAPSNGDGEKGEVESISSPGCGTATISCEHTT